MAHVGPNDVLPPTISDGVAVPTCAGIHMDSSIISTLDVLNGILRVFTFATPAMGGHGAIGRLNGAVNSLMAMVAYMRPFYFELRSKCRDSVNSCP